MGSFTAGAGTSYLLSSTAPVPSGTANGVLYLNASKVMTSGSALTFDGANFTTTGYAAGNGIRSLGGIPVRFYNAANSNWSQISAPVGTGDMQFDTGAGEQMRLTSTGLGIGTSSPVGKLDTRGTAYLGSDSNNSLVVDSTSSTVTIAAAGRTAFSTSALRFLTSDGTAALERMRLDSAGNLGLGVTPSAWNLGKAFEINFVGNSLWGATTTQLNLLQNAYWNGGFKYANSVSSPASYYSQISGVHAWHTAPSNTAGNAISFTQAMTLDASGRLGIGETNPATLLHAKGTGDVSVRVQSTSGGARLQLRSSNGYDEIQFGTTGAIQIGGWPHANASFTVTISGNAIFQNKNTGQSRFFPLAADPAGAEAGDVYYNSSTNKLRVYNGTAWVDLH